MDSKQPLDGNLPQLAENQYRQNGYSDLETSHKNHSYTPIQQDTSGDVYTQHRHQDTLRRRFTWLLPAIIASIITALVLGVPLGAGLGTSLSSCQGKLKQDHSSTVTKTVVLSASGGSTVTVSTSVPSATTTGTLSNYDPVPYTQIASLDFDCSSLGSSQTSKRGDHYTVVCNRDFISASNGSITDLVGIISYSFADCLQACSMFNVESNRWSYGQQCQSISFCPYMTSGVNNDGGNCWLKNATATDEWIAHLPSTTRVSSANLVS